LTLRDQDWLLEELGNLERAGIKAAMVAPAPVNGRPLAHPDLDATWRAFVEHDVALVFHVGGFRKPFDPAWYALDPEPVDKVLDSTLLWVPAAIAIHNMSLHGALERHPGLRIGVIELTAHWVPEFLMMQEGALGFYVLRHGEPPTPLPLKPSEYFLRQVKVCAMAYEVHLLSAELARNESFGEVLERVYMAGSDWPHAEGIVHPREGFEDAVRDLPEPARRTLLADNARWLLNL
jgi:predicted TIM-barrel fold metal-dependent hydrolase